MKNTALLLAVTAAVGMMFGAQPAVAGSVAVAQMGPQTAPISRTERAQLTAQIEKKWGYYVQKVKGISPQVWSRSMNALFRTAEPGNLRRAATMGTYESMVGVLLGHNTTDQQVINAFAASTAPGGVTAQLLGSPAGDLVYNVLTPCRIFDTRVVGGTILNATQRDFIAFNPGGDFTAQGGDVTDCGVPATAAAVVVNVTDVLPVVNNVITVWPFGETRPNVGTIVGVKNGNVSNETVIKITVGGASHFSAYAIGKADLTGTVVGYFSAPAATALDCTTNTKTSANTPAGATVTVKQNCPAGYTITGGGFNVTGNSTNASDWTMNESYQQGGNWSITATNHNATDADTVQEVVTCCRVPGH